MERMNENQMESLVMELLENVEMLEGAEDVPEITRVSTFGSAGVMTLNAGLVVAMDDGTEFQITIVQSR